MRITAKKKNYLFISLLMIVGLIIVFQTKIVQASDLLPSGMVIGDDQGVKVKSDGQYLVDVRDVEPGKEWEKQITIINLEKDIPYHLTMSVSRPTKKVGTLDLSQAIEMELMYDGKSIYKGPLSGDAGKVNLQNLQTPLDLGVFQSGDTHQLQAIFRLDGEKYGNKDFAEKNVLENVWTFRAVKTSPIKTPEKEKPIFRLPQTGEEWKNVLLGTCIGLFLILVVLLIIKYKKNQKG